MSVGDLAGRLLVLSSPARLLFLAWLKASRGQQGLNGRIAADWKYPAESRHPAQGPRSFDLPGGARLVTRLHTPAGLETNVLVDDNEVETPMMAPPVLSHACRAIVVLPPASGGPPYAG